MRRSLEKFDQLKLTIFKIVIILCLGSIMRSLFSWLMRAYVTQLLHAPLLKMLWRMICSYVLKNDHYLGEDVVQKSYRFDLLYWWKVNKLKYPNLQCMARYFLAIPASTVTSESAFSSSGRLISPHRNRLHPKQ